MGRPMAQSPVNSSAISVTEASTSGGIPSTRRHRTSSVELSSTTGVLPCWDFMGLWFMSSSEESSQLLERCKFVLLTFRSKDVISRYLILIFVDVRLRVEDASRRGNTIVTFFFKR